jgi:urea transport system substrate-binding protein
MANHSVLVVDDDPVILATVAEILSHEGYPTLTASNGLEALQEFERAHPQLVLLDLSMPVVDGWDFARVLADCRDQLRIIVMTAAPDGRRCAERLGADGYLPKPFDLEALISEVKRLTAG